MKIEIILYSYLISRQYRESSIGSASADMDALCRTSEDEA